MKFAVSIDLRKCLLGGLFAMLLVLLMPLGAISSGKGFANAAPLSSASDNARTYIISPQDGDTVSEEFTVVFGLAGMGIAPAGFDHDWNPSRTREERLGHSPSAWVWDVEWYRYQQSLWEGSSAFVEQAEALLRQLRTALRPLRLHKNTFNVVHSVSRLRGFVVLARVAQR